MLPINILRNTVPRLKELTENGRIIAIGELLIDFVPGRKNMRLSDSGEMIKTASGSSGIFACAVAKLSGQAGFMGKVGVDSLSQMAVNTIRAQGVDLSSVKVSKEGQIGLAFIEYTDQGRNYQYYRKNSVGSQFSVDDLDEQYIKNAFAIHYPGMLLELTDSMRGACIKAVEIARQAGVIVSFDPNIRYEMVSDGKAQERLLWAVRNADIIAPTVEEAAFIQKNRI